MALIFHNHSSTNLQPFQMEQVRILTELFLEVVEYLYNGRSTKLIFFFVIVDIIPKLISDGEILFFNFHTCLDRFSSFDSFLNYFVNLVQVDSSFSNQIIVSNQISIPNLNSENIWIHILRFRRIKYWEFETVVKTSNWSTCPVSISLLRFRSSYHTSNKNIVWLHLYILVNTVICFPDNNSQLIFVKWRGMDLVSWSIDPFFLFDQINPSLQSSLSTYSEFRIKVSKFNRLFLIEMPFLCEISVLNIKLSKTKSFCYQFSENIMSFHYFYFDNTWTW